MKKLAACIISMGFLSLGLTIVGVAALFEATSDRFHKDNN